MIAAARVHVASTSRPRLLEGAWIVEPHLAEYYDPDNSVIGGAGTVGRTRTAVPRPQLAQSIRALL